MDHEMAEHHAQPAAAAHKPSNPSTFWAVVLLLALVVLWALREIVTLVAFAVLLAYALDPVVVTIERIRLPRVGAISRGFAAALVTVALVVGTGLALAWTLPRLAAEVAEFARNLPANTEALLERLRAGALERGLDIEPALAQWRANTATMTRDLGGLAAGWIGRLFGGLIQVLGWAVAPLLTFYLLAEREAVQRSVLGFVPRGMRPRLAGVTAAMDRALRSYVRGQALVCLIMGAVVGAILFLLGFRVALLLAVVVGIAEIVPYLGAVVAALAIALAGFSTSPFHAALGVGIYFVVNQLVGLLVTPRVMGRHLKMHPFVVTVSILAGAQLLGPAGAILALPGAAVIQALIAELAPRSVQERGHIRS